MVCDNGIYSFQSIVGSLEDLIIVTLYLPDLQKIVF